MYANFVSTIALFASIAALLLHWRKYKRDASDRQPEVKATAAQSIPGWVQLTVTVRNRSDATITADRLTAQWPPFTRVVRETAVIIPIGDPAEAQYETKIPANLTRSIEPTLKVAHAGSVPRNYPSGGIEMGSGDTHSEAFLFSVSRKSRKSRVRLRMEFSSADISQQIRASIIVVTIVAAEQTNQIHVAVM